LTNSFIYIAAQLGQSESSLPEKILVPSRMSKEALWVVNPSPHTRARIGRAGAQRRLSCSDAESIILEMSTKAQAILEEFKKLDPSEQRSVWNELAQTVAPADYGPLTDEELAAIVDQTFVFLDEEEADAQTR
jgi:hypothetical protein